MQIRLVLPPEADLPTQANAYARRMLAALVAVGHDAAGLHLPPSATPDSVAALWAALPPRATLLIDGAVLAAFAPLRGELAGRGAIALMHQPSALEPGLSEASHASLAQAERALLPLLPRIVVVSQAVAARLMEAFGVPRDHLLIVPPGSDPAPRSTGSGGAGCHVLSVGALVPRKGHDVLLRALARLYDLDWRLTLVGTSARHPAHAAALLALAEELDIAGRVTFAGLPDAETLRTLWQGADIFALATRWEASGAAACEALRHGLPVAVCQGGAAATPITPRNGIVTTPGDPDQLSKGLRRLIFDPALRAEMAEAAWHSGTQLPDWPTQAAALVAALAQSGAAPI